jgi:hypothetical protein
MKQGDSGDIFAGCNVSSHYKELLEYADYKEKTNTSIVYGFLSAEELVAKWIVNAGVMGKTDRMNIMNCSYDSVGVGLSTPLNASLAGPIAVIGYSANFTCKNNNSCPSLPPMDVFYNCSAGGYPVDICSAEKLSIYLVTVLLLAVTYLLN